MSSVEPRPTRVASSGSDGRTRSPAERAAEHLETHFEDLGKQTHAALLGMWIFLATEVLFFGGLFALYASYRVAYSHSFALAAQHTDLDLGTIGTYVLLTGSFCVALAVGAIRVDRNKLASLLLWAAALTALAFLALKFTEYGHHFSEGLYPGRFYRFPELRNRGAHAFFTLYYLMTGLHALHVIGGFVILSVLAIRAWQGAYDSTYNTPLELGGMYWHFVDVVWLFLWPFFYLLR